MTTSYRRLLNHNVSYKSPVDDLDEKKLEVMEKLKKGVTEKIPEYEEFERLRNFCNKQDFYYKHCVVGGWKEKNIKPLLKLIEGNLKWRKENHPMSRSLKDLSEYATKNNLVDFKILIPYGYDKNGRPILYMNLAEAYRLTLDEDGVDFLFFLIVAIMEDLMKYMPKGHHNFTLVLDVTGVGLGFANIIRKIGKRFSDFGMYYCGLLHKAYIVNAGWIMRSIFGVAKLFMEKHSSDKFNFAKDTSELNLLIDEQHILQDFGGKTKLKFKLLEFLELLEKDRSGKVHEEEEIGEVDEVDS